MVTIAIDNRVKQVVANIRNLPTPPIVFHQIQKVTSSPNASAQQIANILAEDPAMSAKVLKLTNSAFYGLPREIDSVKQAVVIVGLEAIKNLVLSASVLDMFKGETVDQEFTERFWRHSLAVGFGARLLAREVKSRGVADPDAAFSAGLLHDIGKVVICCFLPQDYLKFNEVRLKDKLRMTFEIEEEVLGYNHCHIGALLTMQWKLPAKLTEAVSFHHLPQLCESGDPLPYLVALANHLAKSCFYDREEEHLIGAVDHHILDYLQINGEAFIAFGDKLREEYMKAETFMKLAGLG